ncbi:hypothetical protein MJT46_006609 [Ovis ammon polii x Ovis aries]|nr:hypothetical protein MJT46_006609 [Ovis ammon polii x Ovis aries]
MGSRTSGTGTYGTQRNRTPTTEGASPEVEDSEDRSGTEEGGGTQHPGRSALELYTRGHRRRAEGTAPVGHRELKLSVTALSYLSSQTQTCDQGHTEGSDFCVGSSQGFNFQTPDSSPPPDPPGRLVDQAVVPTW